MYGENQVKDIESVENNLKAKLKDFALFKKSVYYKESLVKFATALYGIGIFGIVANALATYNVMDQYNVSMEFFVDYFFDTTGGTWNTIFYYASIAGIVLIGVATALIVFGLVKGKSNYQKIYDQFISSPNITHKKTVLISKTFQKLSREEVKPTKTTDLFYLIFKNEEDAEKMLDLINQDAFKDDKKYDQTIYTTQNDSFYGLSKYLMKNYHLSDEIEEVIYCKYADNILKCESGEYRLFVEANGRHLIEIDKIKQEL